MIKFHGVDHRLLHDPGGVFLGVSMSRIVSGINDDVVR